MISVSYFYIFYLISKVSFLTSERTSKYSGVTEWGASVARAPPWKKTAQTKAMFFNEDNMNLHREFKREQT